MDTGTVTATSTGKKSTNPPTLASGPGRAVKPSQPVQTKNVNASTLETLAELLSLIQEDCRRYNATLAEYLPNQRAVLLKFDGDGVIYLAAPPNHRLDTGNGHILLDGKPVTGWADTGETLAGKK